MQKTKKLIWTGGGTRTRDLRNDRIQRTNQLCYTGHRFALVTQHVKDLVVLPEADLHRRRPIVGGSAR